MKTQENKPGFLIYACQDVRLNLSVQMFIWTPLIQTNTSLNHKVELHIPLILRTRQNQLNESVKVFGYLQKICFIHKRWKINQAEKEGCWEQTGLNRIISSCLNISGFWDPAMSKLLSRIILISERERCPECMKTKHWTHKELTSILIHHLMS